MDTRGSKSETRTSDGKKPRETGDIAKIISMAEYELQQDPYRGMVINDPYNPWMECRSSDEEHGIVSQTCRCACPSLVSWTRDLEALKRRKKRKRAENDIPQLGRRRDDPKFKCPCDHNPFCLVSVGGTMDDFLAQTLILNTKMGEDQGVSDVSDIEIIDVINVEDLESPCIPLDDDTLISSKAVDEDDAVKVVDRKQIIEKKMIPAPIPKVNLAALPDKSRTPSEAFLEEVTFTSDELDPNVSSCIYSTITKEQLNATRRVVYIHLGPIRKYVERTILPHSDETCTPIAYCERLRRLHDKMVFLNPLKDNNHFVNDKMRFAMPPGMKNLGATCYLNTQLQCLARNTAFLEGILAWKPSKSESRMDSVLSKLQKLLARLAYGVESTTTTEELSEALGLQNDEMQDPNEFARLLFQRMHEAFQQCTQLGKDGKQSLSTLLPTLFEGDMTYETRCQSCAQIRERSEKFMDINLPIVHPKSAKKVKGGQLQIDEAFAVRTKGKVTNVQYCLDSYMFPEELTDENQYWCENCGQKRDATRQVVFSKLPPVLNMQLCRYVYDRKKQTKKKLIDEVMLPHRLDVKSKLFAEPTSYRLCAVMKHLGNSAYQGHYIAEAMDWQTGTWFEFNDEKVKILEDGPSCSTNDDISPRLPKKGSQDAYNMYYVSESFLGKCASKSAANDRIKDDGSVIKQLESERKARYSMLKDFCRNDSRIAERAKRRKRGLMALFNMSFLSDSFTADFSEQEEDFQDMVWVDGDALRSVLACGTEDIQELIEKISSGDLYLCEHEVGLHPRVARCGKLLPRQMYKQLLSVLFTEKDFLNAPQFDSEGQQKLLKTCLTINTDNIECKVCAQSYRGRLKQKLELLESLLTVHNILDPKTESATVEVNDDDDMFVYAISKRFVTKLRKAIAAVLKKLDSYDTVLGGLDMLDSLASHPDGALHFSEMLSSEDGVDVRVNSAIVCKSFRWQIGIRHDMSHQFRFAGENGKCCPVNKRTVRFVSEQIWRNICQHFPLAICLKKRKSKEGVWVRCEECEGSNREIESLENWASVVTSGLSLELLKGRRAHKQILTNVMEAEDYFLVNKIDVESLWEAHKLVASNKGDVFSLKCKLKRILFDHAAEFQEDDLLWKKFVTKWRPVPLLCANHKLVLNPLVMLPTVSEVASSTALRWEYSSNIVLFPQGEYRHYIRVVLRLFELVFQMSPVTSTCSNEGEITEDTIDVLESFLTSSCHPRARSQFDDRVEHSISDAFSLVTCSIGEAVLETLMMPAMCADQQCNIECVDFLRNVSTKKPIHRERKVSGHITNQATPADGLELLVIDVDAPSGKAFEEPLLLQVRLVEVEAGTILKEVAKSLIQDESNEDTVVRRSTRKRKQRYHIGPIKTEDMLGLRRDHNFAAIRLHILEKHPSFKVDQPLLLILPTKVSSEGHDEPEVVTIAIPNDWNEKLLYEAVVDATASLQLNASAVDKLLRDMVLVRHATEATSSRRSIKGKEEEVRQVAFVDSLLQIANLTDMTSSKSRGEKKTTTRRVERGFTGTFLHSGPQTSSTIAENAPNENADEMEGKNTKSTSEVNENSKTAKIEDAFILQKTPNGNLVIPDRDEKHELVDTSICSATNANGARHSMVLDALTKVVNSSGTENFDQAKFLSAVTWALRTNSPDACIVDLTDAAYAKYLEVILSCS